MIPGSGSAPGEGNGYPAPHSCLENPMDRRTWWAIVLGVIELDTTEQLTLSLPRVISKVKIAVNINPYIRKMIKFH